MNARPSAPTWDSPAPWLPITSRPKGPTMADADLRRELATVQHAARVAAAMLRHTARDAEMGRSVDPAALRQAAADLTEIAAGTTNEQQGGPR